MGKAAKSKREEAEASAEGDYEFKMPAFNEKAFIRREVQSARASFYTLGLGLVAGAISAGLYLAPIGWQWGWVPILASLFLVRPMLQRLDFPEDVTSWKAMFGSLFMLFFTALAVWILGVNIL